MEADRAPGWMVSEMKITLGSNIASLMAQRSLKESSSALSTVFERLSTGMRINRASDDAAGLAISESLKADTRIYTQAIRNANDGLSILNIADGAISQLQEIVTHQKELAEQAANGVYTREQRRALHEEANELVDELSKLIGELS